MPLFLRFAPMLFGLLALAAWEAAVRIAHVPVYLVPGPIAIIPAFFADPVGLLLSLLSTLTVTFAALLVAATLGSAMAVAMALSRLAQAAIQPWAVVLQVTPIVAIAPLIIVWVGDPSPPWLSARPIVAFFPVFANTAAGLSSAAADLSICSRCTAPAAGRRCGCCGCRRRCPISWQGCGFPVDWPWLAPWSRSSSPARAASRRPGLPDPGSGLPAGNRPHVRGAGAAVAGRDRHQYRAGRLRPSGHAAAGGGVSSRCFPVGDLGADGGGQPQNRMDHRRSTAQTPQALTGIATGNSSLS